MYYYEFVEMNSLQPEERTVIENIYLILNQEWNYGEAEETKKMIKMFARSEEVIERFMSIKEIDIKNNLSFKLTDEEKRLEMIEKPEEWIEKLLHKDFLIPNFAISDFDAEYEERFKALAKFVIKMAVFRFCMIHFPKIVTWEMSIDKKGVKTLNDGLQQWERKLWILKKGLKGNIIAKRKELISHYDLKVYSVGNRWGQSCIMDAYEDKDMFAIVKKLRQHYDGEFTVRKTEDNRKYEGIPEIENMRKLLDIMERHLGNSLTPQDISELKENMQDWEKNIEKLSSMLNDLSTVDLK